MLTLKRLGVRTKIGPLFVLPWKFPYLVVTWYETVIAKHDESDIARQTYFRRIKALPNRSTTTR
jgi:hypothetical protein